MPQPTITGELRKWHHDMNSAGDKCIVGTMAHSDDQIWANGDAVIFFYKDFYDSVNFYLATNGNIALKCPKDEEVKHENKKLNGGSGKIG